jgi:hypothetical protein
MASAVREGETMHQQALPTRRPITAWRSREPTVLSILRLSAPAPSGSDEERRLNLPIGSPIHRNPPPRMTVNRIWQGHFRYWYHANTR